jgi:hypothetical protein
VYKKNSNNNTTKHKHQNEWSSLQETYLSALASGSLPSDSSIINFTLPLSYCVAFAGKLDEINVWSKVFWNCRGEKKKKIDGLHNISFPWDFGPASANSLFCTECQERRLAWPLPPRQQLYFASV